MSDQTSGDAPVGGKLTLTFDQNGSFNVSVEGGIPLQLVVNALEVTKATFVQRQLALIAMQAQQQAGKRLVMPDGSLAPPH